MTTRCSSTGDERLRVPTLPESALVEKDSEMTSLNSRTLDELRLDKPRYDRKSVQPGIAHIGVGGFHRAHQAVYIDRLLNDGTVRDWGIVGIGVMPQDARMRDVMRDQDCLYTSMLKLQGGEVEARVIGSIVRYLYGPDDPEAVLVVLSDPGIRIVTLTISEGGYHMNQVTGEFNPGPDLVADAARRVPTTAFGLIVEALRRRCAAGTPPFTVLSCDNLETNGEVARRMISAYASMRDQALGEWVSSEVAFPNSMVDRITPSTSDDDRAVLTSRFGVEDQWPVASERFTQWVVEDNFPTGRPRFEDVGASMVDDVTPYELMKLRLLNGAHQALAYLGLLAGHHYVHEACADPLLTRMLRTYLAVEAAPTLRVLPGIDLANYQRLVVERFENPAIGDTLARLAVDSSDRLPKFVLPVVRENLQAGRPTRMGALIVASWARFAEGMDDSRRPLALVDRRAPELQERAARQDSDSLAFLGLIDIFGNLGDSQRFGDEYSSALVSLRALGARRTLERWLVSS